MKVVSITSQSRLLHGEWNPKTDKVEKASKNWEQYNQSEGPNNNKASISIYWGITVDTHVTCIHSFILHTSFQGRYLTTIYRFENRSKEW